MASTEEVLKALQNANIATLAATEPEELVIDAETRTITVPSSERLFGVTGDMNIERKYFRCPKIVGDNVDLSTHQIFIAYVYTETESGSIFPSIGVVPYHCEDVEVDGEDITFSWKLTGNVFKNPGFILFKMYAKKTETDPNTVFNTTPAIGTVLATIPDGTEEIVEEYPDVIAQIFDRLDALESGGGGGTGGTTNYENLSNKPQINGVTLTGNKTSGDLKLQPALNISDKTGSDTSYTQEVKRDASTNKLLVPASGGTVDPEQIKQAVNGYLEENPPSGMTAEEKAQLQKNTEDISQLSEDIVNGRVGDGTIGIEKTDFYRITPLSENRFDWNAEPLIDGYYFTGTEEEMAANENYYISKPMLIVPGKTYYQNMETACCLFDEKYKYVRTIKYNENPFVADSNAKYICCSVPKASKYKRYVSESVRGQQAGFVPPFTGDKVEVLSKPLKLEMKQAVENSVLTYKKGKNRFNVNAPHYADGKYIEYGNIKENENYFITHFMDVEENTTYYKNDSGDGFYLDDKFNIIGLSIGEGKTINTPTGCAYYQCSVSNGISGKFYVSTEDGISTFSDTPELTEDAKKAVDNHVKPNSGDINVQINSLQSRFLNGTPAINKPIVTFIDDDGRSEIYDNLLPFLKNKNVKYGAAIITAAIGTDGYMDIAELKECHNSGFVETLSHCYDRYTSLTELSESEIEYQLSKSQEWLKENGFDYNAFVYPQNSTNKLVRTTAMKYYDYCFTGISFNEQKYLDHSLINRIAFGSYESYNPSIDGVDNVDTIEYYKKCVDRAVSNNEWLIFNSHIGVETSYTTSKQIEMLGDLIDYIESLGISIVSPNEGFSLRRNIVNVGDISGTYLFIGNDDYDTNISLHKKENLNGRTANTPISEYKKGRTTICKVDYGSGSNAGFPSTAGFIETYRDSAYDGWSYQKWISYRTCKTYMRFWDEDDTKQWLEWAALN